jgi:hypothetical protein
MSNFLRTGLFSALLFAIAFGVTFWHRSGDDARKRAVQIQGGQSVGFDKTGRGSSGAAIDSPHWHDALLLRALDGRDLVSAVREIMARQQDDHCADTRIVCLVESLPAERLGELVGLLEAFSADAYVHRFVLRAWAQRDAAAALAYISTHPEQRAKHLPDLMEGWTQRDPQAALAWLDGQHSASEARALRTAVLGTIANTDPAQALELLQTKGWLAQTPQLLTRIMQSYGAVKPTEALQAMRSILVKLQGSQGDPHGIDQNFTTLYSAMLNGIWQADPAAAESLGQQLTPEEQMMGKSCYLNEITMRSPGGLEQILRSPMDEETKSTLVSDHSTELLEHFAELPDDEMRKKVLSGGHDSITSLSPAIQEFIAQQPSAEREEILQNLIQRMGQGNAPEALTMWKQLSSEGQSMSGPILFRNYAAESPDQALSELQKCPEAVQAACLRGVCAGMASKQPQAALDLALMQTDPTMQASCLASVLGFWGHQSGTDAIKALEASASRMDLSAVLAQLPKAGRFGNTSYGISFNALETRLREMLNLPTATPIPDNDEP